MFDIFQASCFDSGQKCWSCAASMATDRVQVIFTGLQQMNVIIVINLMINCPWTTLMRSWAQCSRLILNESPVLLTVNTTSQTQESESREPHSLSNFKNICTVRENMTEQRRVQDGWGTAGTFRHRNRLRWAERPTSLTDRNLWTRWSLQKRLNSNTKCSDLVRGNHPLVDWLEKYRFLLFLSPLTVCVAFDKTK